MTNEYITKQQAIDLVKSLEVVLGCLGVSVLTREIERLPDCWISTKDSLPEAREEVLIHHKEIGVFEAFFTDDGYWETDSGWWSRQRDVTHWMPLPEPPKE
jgi:hypothetical protein